MKICYVTAFVELEREKWDTFSRKTEEYLECFYSFTNLFEKKSDPDYCLLVFLDEKIKSKIMRINSNMVHLHYINQEFLNRLPAYKRLEKDREILGSPEFKELVKNRQDCPECRYAEYNAVNHAKIDFVCPVILSEIFN